MFIDICKSASRTEDNFFCILVLLYIGSHYRPITVFFTFTYTLWCLIINVIVNTVQMLLGFNCWQSERVLKVLLQHKGMGRVDSLVVLFFGIHNPVAKLLIELQSFIVAHLHMPIHIRKDTHVSIRME